jgi:hypothetical protein
MSRIAYPLPDKPASGYHNRKLRRSVVRQIVDLADEGRDLHDIARIVKLGWSAVRDVLVVRGYFRDARCTPDERTKFHREQRQREEQRAREAAEHERMMAAIGAELSRAREQAATNPLSCPAPQPIDIDVPTSFSASQDWPLCLHGHPRTPENYTNNGKCRACHNKCERRRHHRREQHRMTAKRKRDAVRASGEFPRKSISIRGATYKRLQEYCQQRGIAVSALIESWIAEQIQEDTQ